jgi:hypothetical protein
MAEVFTEFRTVVTSDDGRAFIPRACGAPLDGNVWQGWIEFVAADNGEVVRTPRETTQPNRPDIAYWATGLTPVYLEGALERALYPRVEIRETLPQSAFEEPAPHAVPLSVPPATANMTEGVLDPFSVYQKGERLLRKQLAALSPWHLVNIIRAYDLSTGDPALLNVMSAPALIELIVSAVRARTEELARR